MKGGLFPINDIIISIKSGREHSFLLEEILKYETNPSRIRSAIMIRAIDEAMSVDDWMAIKDRIPELLRLSDKNEINKIKSMQFKIPESKEKHIDSIKINMAININIKEEIDTVYFVTLVLINYLKAIKENNLFIGDRAKIDNMSIPEMFKVLSEMTFSNSDSGIDSIEKIKTIMIDYKSNLEETL